MEIKLLGPANNSLVEILPIYQDEILSTLPKGDVVVDNLFDWRRPTASGNDNTTPRFVNFSWGIDGSLAGVQAIEIQICENEEFNNPDKYSINPGQAFLSLNNFKRDTVYFWKMVAYGSDGPICISPTYTFKTSDAIPQWFRLPDVTNLRGIGGWKTADNKVIKEGMIFRGSEIRATESKSKAMDFLSNKLKIKTELDLRFADQIKPFNKRIPHAEYHHLPINAYDKINDEEQKSLYRKLFGIFADANSYPIFMHCIGGADRTGTVAALLEAILGVSDDDIATDYELTTLSPYGRSRKTRDYIAFTEFLLSYGDTIKTGAENYLLSCGVTEEEFENIKKIMTV